MAKPEPEIREVIRTEYVMVPDDDNEKYWDEALRRFVRVNGRHGVWAAKQIRELKDLVHSGQAAGSI